MGILDDAIREHLELIRRHGATDSEVRRLEDEAFGPPTRPDEADFPESEEAASGNGVATEAAEPSHEEAAMHEDVTTLLPAEARGPATDQPASAPAEGDAPAEAEAEAPAQAEEPELGAEGAVAEPDVGEQQPAHEEPVAEAHPVVEPEPQAEEESVEEPEAGPPEGTKLYDQESGEEIAFDDLDLTLEEEPAAEEPAAEVSETPEAPEAAEDEGVRPLEPPIESLDTVEHPFPEEIVEKEESHEEASPAEQAGPEEAEPSGHAAAEGEEGEEGEDGEDVLADTPEFLKDAPEDDELWFEQGEPKDFDF